MKPWQPFVVAMTATAALTAQTPGPAVRAVTPDSDVVTLWPEGVPGARADATPEITEEGRVRNVHVPTLTVHAAPDAIRTGTAVIVCPGGGYRRLAFQTEGSQMAAWLNAVGVDTFVLKYRLGEYGHPAPLRDVLRAIRLVRSRAAQWHVNPSRIGVLGFSAGGHLAASAATLFDTAEGKTGAELDGVSGRPDFQILVYPVITMGGPLSHAGSRDNLLGPAPDPALVEQMSLQNRVTAATPPAFLVHGGTDTSVPPENSMMFYAALRKAGVAAELHLYEQGPHGMAVSPWQGPMSDWPRRCQEWMTLHGWLAGPKGKQKPHTMLFPAFR
jgi:acetyl esterase/lipase